MFKIVTIRSQIAGVCFGGFKLMNIKGAAHRARLCINYKLQNYELLVQNSRSAEVVFFVLFKHNTLTWDIKWSWERGVGCSIVSSYSVFNVLVTWVFLSFYSYGLYFKIYYSSDDHLQQKITLLNYHLCLPNW